MGAEHAPTERFCGGCGMPLIDAAGAGPEPTDEAHARARKVKPQYLGGELVKVAWARNLAEAQLIQGILLEEGIPTVERRARGFDVPDFLAAGPRDILVPQAGFEAARRLLTGSPVATDPEPPSALAEPPLRLLAKLGLALAVAAALIWVLWQLVS